MESATPHISALELRVDFLDDEEDEPSLSMLIDGRSVFEAAGSARFQGFDPASMLWDTDALSVTETARRVAV
ncbi:hypothetical protein [Galbitalea soli]|nr:hypothetical protein [Galbitalea soli]